MVVQPKVRTTPSAADVRNVGGRCRCVLCFMPDSNHLVRHGIRRRYEEAPAPRCRPQNSLFKCRNSIINFRDVFPLTYCMILLADMFGGSRNQNMDVVPAHMPLQDFNVVRPTYLFSTSSLNATQLAQTRRASDTS